MMGKQKPDCGSNHKTRVGVTGRASAPQAKGRRKKHPIKGAL